MFLQRYVRIEMKFHYFIYAFFKASAYLSNRIVILKKYKKLYLFKNLTGASDG